MWLHALTSIAFASLCATSIAVADPNRAPTVVAVPFGDDVAGKALFDAVDAALPAATKERGLSSVRADSVKPVVEALRACKDDGCRAKNTRRLNARYAVIGALDHGALALRLVDADVGDTVASVRIDGDPPAVLAKTPSAVDDLLDKVAPKASFARNRALVDARKARTAGELDAADAAFAKAIEASTGSDLVSVWLERVRLYDAADRVKEEASWDAFASSLGPGTPAFSALSDVDKARVKTALHESLSARASFEADELHDAPAAARIHLRIAALFPEESAKETLLAAKLSGDKSLLEKLVHDEGVDDDTRLQALALLHGHP